jgi:hypothetical protein
MSLADEDIMAIVTCVLFFYPTTAMPLAPFSFNVLVIP